MAKTTKKAAKKKTAKKKSTGKRETISPKGDKRFVRRNSKGEFDESDDAGKSLRQDVKKSSKTKVKSGYGDKGDQKKKAAKRKKS